MVRSLDGWMDSPSAERGLRFAREREGWDFMSYADLARAAGGAADQVEAERSRPGEPVVIVLPTGPSFPAAFFGTLLAGDTPCPIPPPGPIQRHMEYHEYLAGVLEAAAPSLVVTDDTLIEVVSNAVDQTGLDIPRLSLQPQASDPRRREPAELGLLQFTSGSSGRPRGVRVTRDNLETNIAMTSRWLGLHDDDRWVSWLPLFHDMGLVGYLLNPILAGVDLWLMRPDQFVRSPARWLQCLGLHGAEVTASPPFGLAFARRHTTDEELRGCDFSGWRATVTAAERLDAPIVRNFVEWLAPYGFRPETIKPAYGLAENTLAVTGTPLETVPPVVEIDPGHFQMGEPVEIRTRTSVADTAGIGSGPGWLVGSGQAHAGIGGREAIGVEIRDEDGELLPEGHLGEVHVTGPCVAHGYMGQDRVGSARFAEGVLFTGDAGFLVDGELYVVGRMGDSVKVRGRNVYMEDIEAELREVPGIPTKGRLVATAGTGAEGDVLCAVIEAEAGDWVHGVAETLQRASSGEFTVRVFTAGFGTIMRTSSGKPRRRPMWRALAEGKLPVTLALKLPPVAQVAPVAPVAQDVQDAPVAPVAPDVEAGNGAVPVRTQAPEPAGR